MKDLAVIFLQAAYRAVHITRSFLFPSFEAKKHKFLNNLIGKIMGLKVRRILTTEGITLTLDQKDSLALSFNRIYEPDETSFVKKTISPEMRVLDIGANIGYYTTLFSKLAYQGEVFAFEPDESNFKLLQENCHSNNCKNIKLFKKAVGDKDCLKKLFLSQDNMGDHRLYPVENGRAISKVEMISIDRLLKTEKPFDFIKIDIQGFEMNALLGMTNRVTQDSPILLLEIWPEALLKNNVNPLHLLGWIVDHKYEINDINHPERKIKPSEFLKWIDSIKDHANIVCSKKY